jgi:uncharacterized protein YdhG (YjbR/CyaY superfamily)
VSTEEVDEYLRGVEEPQRGVLQTLHRTILEVVPEAEEVISYPVPAFRVRGDTVAGFAAFKTSSRSASLKPAVAHAERRVRAAGLLTGG